MSTFYDNTLNFLHQLLYDKTEDKTNFNEFWDNNCKYNNGNLTIGYTHKLSPTGEYTSLQDIIADDLDEYRIFVEGGNYTYTTGVTFNVPTSIIGDPFNPPVVNCTTGARWCYINLSDYTNVESTVSNITWNGTNTVNQYGLAYNVGSNKVKVTNCNFNNIWATYNGQALRFYGCTEGSDVTVAKCSFKDNTTRGYGHIFGSIIVGGTKISNLLVHHCTFNNIKPLTTNAKSGANGGGIIVSNEDYSTTVPEIGTATAKCNTYVDSSIDYNYRVTETQCE